MKKLIGISLICGLGFSFAPMAPAEGATAARTKYTKCLRMFGNEHLDLKTTVAAFDEAIKDACKEEKQATWEETRKDELSYGSSDQEARDFADEDITEMLRLIVERYGSLSSDNARFPD